MTYHINATVTSRAEPCIFFQVAFLAWKQHDKDPGAASFIQRLAALCKVTFFFSVPDASSCVSTYGPLQKQQHGNPAHQYPCDFFDPGYINATFLWRCYQDLSRTFDSNRFRCLRELWNLGQVRRQPFLEHWPLPLDKAVLNRVGARGRMKASKVLATNAIGKSRLQDFRTTVPGLHWAGLLVLWICTTIGSASMLMMTVWTQVSIQSCTAHIFTCDQ